MDSTPADSTSVRRDPEDFTANLDADLNGLRIGIAKEHFDERLDQDISGQLHSALEVLVGLGANIKEISLKQSDLATSVYYVVAPAECSSNLSRFDGVRFGHRAADANDLEELYKRSRSEGFGTEVKRRIMIGTYALSAGYYDAYYLKAQRLRRLISQEFTAAFKDVDVIAGPTSPFAAFPVGEKIDDPVMDVPV